MNLPRYQQPVLPQGANLRHHNYRLSDPRMYVSANQMYGAKADIGRSLAGAMQGIGNNIRSDRLRDEANARADQIRAEQQARQDARYAVQDQRYADQQERKDALFKMEQDKHKRWYVEQGQEDTDRTIGNESRSLKLDEARANHRHKVLMSLHNASRGVKNQNEWNNLIQRYDKLGYGDIIRPYADYETGNRLLSSEMQVGSAATQGKAPSGYRWSADGNLEAIPGGPATKQSFSDAAKTAMIRKGFSDLDQVEQLLGLNKGSSNPMGWADSRRVGMVLGVGSAARAGRIMRLSVEAILRAMTGAAAPPHEVDSYMDMFGPTSTDTAATMSEKIARLKSVLSGTVADAVKGRGGEPLDSGGPKIKSITPIE